MVWFQLNLVTDVRRKAWPAVFTTQTCRVPELQEVLVENVDYAAGHAI